MKLNLKEYKFRASKSLLLILTLALLIRVLITFFIFNDSDPVGDTQYHLYAVNIAEGKGFLIDNFPEIEAGETVWSTGLDVLYSFKPPLYPFFLASIYSVFGPNFIIVRIIQAILGTLTCLVVFHIAKKIFDEKVGLIAALILALYPYHIWQGTRISDIALFSFLLALSLLSLCNVAERASCKNLVLSGVFIGLAILCRSNMIAFIPFIALWLWLLFFRTKTLAVKSISLIYVFIILTLLPWIIRNHIVHEQPVFLGTNGGYTFWQAHNQYTEKYIKRRSDLDPIVSKEKLNWEARGVYDLSESDRDRWFFKEGFKFISDHPLDAVKLAWLKFLSLWSWRLYPSSEGKIKNITYTFTYGPMLILALISIVFTLNRWRKTSLLLFLFLSFSILYAVFYGKTIYRAPLDPFLFIFSAYLMKKIWIKIKNPFISRHLFTI